MTHPRQTTTPDGVYTLREDGVLHVVSTARTHTAPQAQVALRAIAGLLAGHRAPLVIDLRQVVDVPPDAHRAYSSPEASLLISAVALVVGGRLSQLVGQMAEAMRGVTGQRAPLRVFHDEAAALAWAHTHVAAAPRAALG